ncbi:hypothetical protein [Sagittula stellata]|uniref:AB hydrolase-1 domain-containing protein n=1 Tax=Sagittula stellata (strain ATCC 700073 / DSM 11524 / E-37) TaxID=388399 RepID=A3JY55_SAGS3|nr:hypothetical protein [Sagittula stellata]EBA10441.1 hypothetical protein SSE37_20587 [Sagittula stellata E-37]
MNDATELSSAALAQQEAEFDPAPPDTLKARLKRLALVTAAAIAPVRTANVLAERYLSSSHGFIDELAEKGRHRFEILPVGDDMAIMRHSHHPGARRVLVVPGHDGHYRQFTRLLRALDKTGLSVDVTVLPGHMHKAQTVCSMRDITEAIHRSWEAHGPYDGMVAHCVSSNAALFALDGGLHCDRVVLVSTPLDLVRLVRNGGEQYGLSGRCLDLFVDRVSELGAPFHLSLPWHPIAAERTEHLLAVHARDDWAAPVCDVQKLESLTPTATVAVFPHGGHNSILSVKTAVSRIADFLKA